MRNLLAAYGAMQIIFGVAVAYMFINPKAGRPHANSHPEVRGGGDKGFGGLDFYEDA